jgi:hypothetical protein
MERVELGRKPYAEEFRQVWLFSSQLLHCQLRLPHRQKRREFASLESGKVWQQTSSLERDVSGHSIDGRRRIVVSAIKHNAGPFRCARICHLGSQLNRFIEVADSIDEPARMRLTACEDSAVERGPIDIH